MYNRTPRVLTLAVTGASGSIYAIEMLRALEADTRVQRVDFVVSPSAMRVLAQESSIHGRAALVEKILGQPSEKIRLFAHKDIGAPMASGSYPSDAMIVLPCSMATLAGVAHGLATNLIERAADVCLKERRQLILCVRRDAAEPDPHSATMAAATEAGAVVYPCIPHALRQAAGHRCHGAQLRPSRIARCGPAAGRGVSVGRGPCACGGINSYGFTLWWPRRESKKFAITSSASLVSGSEGSFQKA